MSSFRLRPRFTHVIDLALDATREKIVAAAKQDPDGCEVKNFPGFICLRIPESERHFWSPRLNLSLDAEGDSRTRISGTYGPNANMWSSFLYAYLIIGSLAIFSGILGACQLTLHMTPWGAWIFGLMMALAAGLYVTAQFGQKLAAQQMFRLHQTYERAAGESVAIE